MSQDVLAQLRAIDIRLLTEVVRQDQRSPTFDISEWHVDRLSSKGIVNPDGLFRFSGHGRDGQATRPWSVVLKIVRKPNEDQNPRDIWYWKRELLAAQHNLLPQLPGPVTAPRIYGVIEHADSGWLWMEHIIEATTQPWTLAQYAFAARALGRFNAMSLMGTPLPDYAWLCTEHCRWWLAGIETLEPQKAWDNRFVSEAFPETLRSRVEQLWAEKELFLAVLNRVPQVFSHFDTQRRNLFIRERDGRGNEVVAVDWAFVGRAALGGDLFALVGSTAILFEVEPEDALALEAVAMDAYLSGLREAGWLGDADLVRLGYAAWFALWMGLGGPAVTAAWTSLWVDALLQQFGRGPESVAAGWARLCELALDRADEARQLMARLRLG